MADKADKYNDYNYKPVRVARPDEVNYALIQDMGEGFKKHTVQISALGMTFDMVYGEWVNVGLSREDSPIILCLHGAPATYAAFRPIMSHIASRGYRVLAVNFPGNGYTKVDPKGRYDFTTAQKIQLIKAFMNALNIQNVHMTVGHSLGSHIVCSLAADPEVGDRVSSACVICSSGLRPDKYYKRNLSLSIFAPVIKWSTFLPLIGPYLKHFYARQIFLSGFRAKTREAQVLGVYEGYKMRYDLFEKDLERLAERRIPFLLFYGLDDTIVDPEVIPAVISTLQIPENDIKTYDKERNSDIEFPDSTLRRVVRFAKGSHRVHYANPKETIAEILSLLNLMKSKL